MAVSIGRELLGPLFCVFLSLYNIITIQACRREGSKKQEQQYFIAWRIVGSNCLVDLSEQVCTRGFSWLSIVSEEGLGKLCPNKVNEINDT